MSEARSVHIGEQSIRIPPFRAYKAMLAGEIVARVSGEVMRLIDKSAEYEQSYREKHKIKLTLEEARARGFGIPEEEFGPDGVLELPAVPTNEEKFLAIFPEAFKLAKEEIIQLLALVVIPNSDLQQAEANGDEAVYDELSSRGKQLLFDAEIGELLELAGITVDLVKEQVDDHREAVGKIRNALFTEETEIEEVEITEEPKAGTFEIVPVEETSDDRSPDSSTSTPTPTDGTEDKSFLEPHTANS